MASNACDALLLDTDLLLTLSEARDSYFLSNGYIYDEANGNPRDISTNPASRPRGVSSPAEMRRVFNMWLPRQGAVADSDHCDVLDESPAGTRASRSAALTETRKQDELKKA